TTARWCRDIDLILTDSQATAEMYRDSLGVVATPVGKFIDRARFVAERHERTRLLFINPNWEKGASIVVQLALLLEQQRPDITLEVVEARSDWASILKQVTARLGSERETLANVVVTANTNDMRPVYARARVLLAPSLWWESGARVLAEAMLNAIPAIVSNRGGSPGLIEDGGVVLDFPEACYEKPYQYLLSEAELQPLVDAVVALFDDQAHYQATVERAERVGRDRHHISVSTHRLTQALGPLINQRAGDKDFLRIQRQQHKHKLAAEAAPVDFSKAPAEPRTPSFTISPPGEKAIAQAASAAAPRSASAPQTLPAGATPPAASESAAEFDWQLQGRVLVLDNRAKLLRSGAWDSLRETRAFSLLAFDPASEVQNPAQFEGRDDAQLFPHALLGDGQPASLHACLDPALSSTLKPLPAEQLPEHQRQGARVLTTLPISTLALDSIEGLGSLDWLILDDLSDAMAILEHGEQQLQQTLLLQVRVAFQPTHERQPNLAELQHWASRHGFRFYRFNDSQHHSLFPQESSARQRVASELSSADALFLPSHERLRRMPESDKQKLAFVLHSVFNATDAAYRVIHDLDPETAAAYLAFVAGHAAPGQVNPVTHAEAAAAAAKGADVSPEETWLLHIGMYRTGTTTLQEHFFSNQPGYFGRSKKKYGGWGYDDSSRLLLQAAQDCNNDSIERWLTSARERNQASGVPRFVFSNEALISPVERHIFPFQHQFTGDDDRLTSPIFEFLRKLKTGALAAQELKLLFVVRNQADWLHSYYARVSDRVVGASQADFELQVEQILAQSAFWLDWSLWVSQLDALLGREHVCVLAMETMGERRFWDQLCAFSGCVEDFSVMENGLKENVSAIDGHRKKLAPLQEGFSRAFSEDDLKSLDHGRGSFVELTESLRHRILEQVEQSNHALQERLGVDLHDYGYFNLEQSVKKALISGKKLF
ncbi:MAG: glycosyltransferase, partial [Gammaproteobacteria bacterium]|nr:glycosyltransferase [Gammaproteobacteria bacterium]